jgi:ribose 5-phosphate isomerase A
VRGVPTSEATAIQARRLGIPLARLSELDAARSPHLLDLAVDGADEVDPQLNLIKGLGKALLREKLVEIHARLLMIIVDESKVSARLGSRSPLPVEIVTFEAETTVRWLNSLGCRAELWRDERGQPYLTDNGNYLVRCWFEDQAGKPVGIHDVQVLACQLAERPGIVEHGLFLGMAGRVIVAGQEGIRILEREL